MIASIPMSISPAATDYLTKFGLQREYQQILDHTLAAVPELQRLEIVVDECLNSDNPSEPAVMIRAYVPLTDDPDISIEWDWDKWMIATFPPTIGRHFVLAIKDAAAQSK